MFQLCRLAVVFVLAPIGVLHWGTSLSESSQAQGAVTINTQPAPGYAAWFKADAIVGLGDGDPVDLWEDSSPNNKDASQSTNTFRPIYMTNIAAGKPVLHFDGVDDRLVSPSGSDWGLTNHFTVFAVVRLDPSPGMGGQDVVGSNAFFNNLDLIARRNDANGNWLAYYSSPDGTRNSDLVLSAGTWYVLTWRLHANPPKHLQIRANKTYRLNDTGYTGIGAGPWQAAIGGRENGTSPFKGDIAELIFYTGSLSDADMEATEDYLLEKYGLAEPPPPPPATPTGLIATTVNHESIDLTWTDNSTDEDGFRVERRLGQVGTFEPDTTLGSDATSHSDGSLVAETEYCYRIVAFNAGGDSDPSNVACAATSEAPPGPGPAGDPAPGYVAWFKADGMTGFNNGDPVDVWEDSGPSEMGATQTTASFRPVYRAGIVGGRPALYFDGMDDRLVSPPGSDIWGLTNHFTVFAVVRLDPAPGTGGQDIVGSSSISNNLDLIARRSEVNGSWLAHSSTQDGTRNSDLVLSPGTWYVLTWRLKAFEHLQIRANRVYRLNDAGYAGSGTAPSEAAIGARENGTNPSKGDIAEVIFYAGSLSDADMESTEVYLLEKYGLSDAPPVPTGLTATAFQQRIHLAWTDNATNEDGFRIERREGQGGNFEEMWSVGAEVTEFLDESVVAATEYCYRVRAFNDDGNSSYSEISCATTAPLTAIACNLDAEDAESGVADILTRPGLAEWRTETGLSSADPEDLALITDDATCQSLWTAISRRDPYPGDLVTFFELADRYIITEYPEYDPNNVAVGYRLTTVVDEQFQRVGPTLAE
ncbi:MAG: fibronectin type III domain-containing protein [Gemmatimonadota bacterium]